MRFRQIAIRSRSFCARTIAAALAVALLLATFCQSQAAEPKRVLMLQSFGLRFKPWTDFAEFLRPEMSPFVDYLQALYGAKPPDLIVALGAPAAEFVQRYRPQLFPKTPMMFTAVEARRVRYDKLTEYDMVAAAAHNFPAAIQTILEVQPETKLIAVVNGASPMRRFGKACSSGNSRRSAGVLNCDGTTRCHSKIF